MGKYNFFVIRYGMDFTVSFLCNVCYMIMRNVHAGWSLHYRGSQIMNHWIVTCFPILTVSYTMYIILLFFENFLCFLKIKMEKQKKAGKMFYHKKKQMKN